ncbi:MAG: hypothetical protein KUG77_00055 [Nannocystaceae bacterium]|nr:hypothetical protein [Nannocystaceae bacterium]
MKDTRRAIALFLAMALGPACEDEGDPADGGDPRDVPEAVEGCPGDEEIVAIGETRVCVCDDGTTAEQTCLSTGEFADCKCAGGGW